jgi:hypothetical protein
MGDVLHRLLAAVGERERQLVAHLLVCRSGDADAARFRQRLQPRRHVHTVAEQIAPLDDDVADIDAGAQFDAAVGRQPRVAHEHPALDRDGASHRLHRRGELDQEGVAHGLEDAAVVARHQRLDHLAPTRGERTQRAELVGFDQPRIADHVGDQDRRQPPLDMPLLHRPPPSGFQPSAG